MLVLLVAFDLLGVVSDSNEEDHTRRASKEGTSWWWHQGLKQQRNKSSWSKMGCFLWKSMLRRSPFDIILLCDIGVVCLAPKRRLFDCIGLCGSSTWRYNGRISRTRHNASWHSRTLTIEMRTCNMHHPKFVKSINNPNSITSLPKERKTLQTLQNFHT